MSTALSLLVCAGPGAVERSLVIGGAVVERGGTVVLLTYTPGLALRRTAFALEVIVRREEDLSRELLRLEPLALSRGVGAVLLDDPRIDERCAAAVRVLSEQVPVARYGPPLAGGAGGELVIDPFGPFGPFGPLQPRVPPESEPDGPRQPGGHFGLAYLPLPPPLRRLRERRPPGAMAEVECVTVACGEGQGGLDRALRALAALSAWRPVLRVALVCDPGLARVDRARLDLAVLQSRHDVFIRPQTGWSHLGEMLLCDLAIVAEAEVAAMAAFLGTPVLVLSPDAAEAARCEVLARAGLVVHVPDFGEAAPSIAFLGDLLWSLCADSGRRTALSQAGRQALDGRGAERTAAVLIDLARRPRR
ncbi:MAG: hypothetical protein RMK29_13695 [Myxococcales bacterium]|nr:hypothetical protein [Myxococcota bacterium]MDW8282762.1 hypothetical protein [Myxococcales bacterium]